MMKKLLVLLFPLYLFSAVNPYTNLGVDEKLSIMINYFLNEELKTKLFGAVWDYYCLLEDVPVGESYITDIQQYETGVLSKR